MRLRLGLLFLVSCVADDCLPGTYIVGTTCLECPLGYYSYGYNTTQCSQCYRGTFQNQTGQTSCYSCPLGTSSTVFGANSSSFCIQCPIGSYSYSSYSSCNFCFEGSYADQVGSWFCTGCSPGTFSAAIGANSSSTCQQCPIGTFASSTYSVSCTSCFEGFYQNITGQDTCIPCPAGTYSTELAANTSNVCKECPVGMYSKEGNTQCGFCNAGSYSNVTGARECTSCPAGTASNEIGANSSSVCKLCEAGYFSRSGMSSCYTCFAGSYSEFSGASDCTGCPAGTFSTEIGSNSSSTCIQCSAGSYAPHSSSSTCSLCPRGSYQALDGQAYCHSCFPGFTTNFTGANSSSLCIACSENVTDDDITADDDADDDSSISFCVQFSATATPTTSGTTSSSATSSSSASITSSASATASSYSSSSVTSSASSSSSATHRIKPPRSPSSSATRTSLVTIIPSASTTATSSSSASATSSSKDITSFFNSISPTPTSTPTTLPFNIQFSSASSSASATSSSSSTSTYSPTASLSLTMTTTPSSSATFLSLSCQAGYIKTQQSTCEACSAGTISNVNNTICIPCPVGYISEQAQSECKPCPAGSFASGPSSCLPCPAGSYSSSAGFGVNCSLCEVGSYTNKTGSITCTRCDTRFLCPLGSINPGPCLFCSGSSDSTVVLNSISNVTTTAEATEALLTISAVANVLSRFGGNESQSTNSTLLAETRAAETAFRSAIISQLETIVNVIASSSSTTTTTQQNISSMNSSQFSKLLNDTTIPLTEAVSSSLASDLKALTSNPAQITSESAKSSLNTITTLLSLSLPVNVQSGAIDAAGTSVSIDSNSIPPMPEKAASDFLSAISNVLNSDAVSALSVSSSDINSTTSSLSSGQGNVNEENERLYEENERQKASAATVILSQISTALNKLSAAVLRSATIETGPVSIVSAPSGSLFNSSSTISQSFCGPALSMTVQRISMQTINGSSNASDNLLSVPLTNPLSPCLSSNDNTTSSSSSLSSTSQQRRLLNTIITRPSITANKEFIQSATKSTSSSIDLSFVQNGLSPVPQSSGFASIGSGSNTTIVDASSPLDTRVVSVTFLSRSGQKIDINNAQSPLILQLPLLNPSVMDQSSKLVMSYKRRFFNITCPGKNSNFASSSSSSSSSSSLSQVFAQMYTISINELVETKQEIYLAISKSTSTNNAIGTTTISIPCDIPVGNRSYMCEESSISYFITYSCPILRVKPVCAFWNVTLNEWSTNGCVVSQSSSASIECSCNHTTNFAARFTALAENQKVIFTGTAIRENPITLLKQYPYVFILIGAIAVFTMFALLIAYDLDTEASARYYQSLKNDPEIQFLERIETLKGNVFILDSEIDKHILLVQEKLKRARLENDASILAKKSGKFYLGHREILPTDISLYKTVWSFPIPDGVITRLRSGQLSLFCKKRERIAISVTSKEGKETLKGLTDNPMLISKKVPINPEISIPLDQISHHHHHHHHQENIFSRQLSWLQSFTDKYTSDLYLRFEKVFDRFSITASNEVIALSKIAGVSSSIVDVMKESQLEQNITVSHLSSSLENTEQENDVNTIHLDEIKGSIFQRLLTLRGFIFRTWFLQVLFTHPLLSIFTKHDPRNPRFFRTIRLSTVMIGSLWTPIFFYGFIHGSFNKTKNEESSLGELDFLELIVFTIMSAAVQVPLSMALSMLLVNAGKAEFNKRYPFLAQELRRRAKVEDELCKMSRPLLEAELRNLLNDESALTLDLKTQKNTSNTSINSDTKVETKNLLQIKSISTGLETSGGGGDESGNSITSDTSHTQINSLPLSAIPNDHHSSDENNYAYGWIDAPLDLQQKCPSLLRICGRHPSQKAAYVAKALKAEEERHALLKEKYKQKRKAAINSKANKRSKQTISTSSNENRFITTNAVVSAVGTATALSIHTDTDENESEENLNLTQDDNDDTDIDGSGMDRSETIDDMLDGDATSGDFLALLFSAIGVLSSLCCSRGASVVNQSVVSMSSKRDLRATSIANENQEQKKEINISKDINGNVKSNGLKEQEHDSIANIYKQASENSKSILISNMPITLQTLSALSLFVVILSFWLFYIAQFGFNQSEKTTLSIVFVWLFNQAFSFILVEPLMTLINVIITFVLLPVLVPLILWIPMIGSAIAGKVACDLANNDGRTVLSGRMENLTLIRAAGAASLLSPEASVVAYGLGAVLSATMSRVGKESLQRNVNGSNKHKDAFHTLTDAQRNDLIVRRYVLAQLNAAQQAQAKQNKLAKKLVQTVTASNIYKDRILGREERRRSNSTSKIDRDNNKNDNKTSVVDDTMTICAFCGEFERVNRVEEEEKVNKLVYCHCGETDDTFQRKEICTVCGEEERFCNCNVEL